MVLSPAKTEVFTYPPLTQRQVVVVDDDDDDRDDDHRLHQPHPSFL